MIKFILVNINDEKYVIFSCIYIESIIYDFKKKKKKKIIIINSP